MSFEDYKLMLYRNQPDGWVAEIPAIAGCHTLMPTEEEPVAELAEVFRLIAEEYSVGCEALPSAVAAEGSGLRRLVRFEPKQRPNLRPKQLD